MTSSPSSPPADWVLAPNIHHHPDLYEAENRALRRDRRLDLALREIADWRGKDLLDLGCGTGFWLPEYGEDARLVLGVEPDPALLPALAQRIRGAPNLRALQGSAEALPLPEASVDIVHARFAYFFGEGAEAGLAEVRRVLRPGGVFIAIDNAWEQGQFARLLEWATQGNGAIDPDRARAWWSQHGATRTLVNGGWHTESPEQLHGILAMEFGEALATRARDEFKLQDTISYAFALYTVKA